MNQKDAIELKDIVLNKCIKTNARVKSYKDYCKLSEEDQDIAEEIQACVMPIVLPRFTMTAALYINAAKECCQIGTPMVKQLAVECRHNKCEKVSRVNLVVNH